MNLLVDQQLAQKIIDYLKVRPYQEVFELIHAILNAPREQTEKKSD